MSYQVQSYAYYVPLCPRRPSSDPVQQVCLALAAVEPSHSFLECRLPRLRFVEYLGEGFRLCIMHYLYRLNVRIWAGISQSNQTEAFEAIDVLMKQGIKTSAELRCRSSACIYLRTNLLSSLSSPIQLYRLEECTKAVIANDMSGPVNRIMARGVMWNLAHRYSSKPSPNLLGLFTLAVSCDALFEVASGPGMMGPSMPTGEIIMSFATRSGCAFATSRPILAPIGIYF